MRARSYLGHVAAALDRLGNALLGGNADASVSGSVGTWAMEGRRWALIAERLIDGLFRLFGAPWGHCRRQAVREGKGPE